MHGIERRTVTVAFLAGIILVSLPAVLHASAQKSVTINGAGATFPYPLIDTWRVEYRKVDPAVSLNYQSIGSGGGIKQFTEKTVDFGASDAPLTQKQRDALPGKAVHIPETIGSVIAAYNIPGFDKKGLKLTGPILADIFLGKITAWNDPAIKAINPDVPIPDKDILVVRRSDGSGTTFVWTDFLSSVSPEWKEKVGKGTAVQWPVGRGAPGNEGVATTIRGTYYSIGYVELAYALTTGMNYAYIQNREGNFIEPTLESTRAAVAAYSATLPAGDASWESVSLVNAPGKDSYPVASFSYILLYKEMSTTPKIDSADKAKEIVDFISWAISPAGQEHARKLSYVPLPDDVVRLNQRTLASLTYNGQPVPGSSPPPATTPQPDDAGKEYKVKLKLSASIKKSTNVMSLSLRNPSSSDAKVYQFEVTLDGATVKSAKAPKGWNAEFDGDTATFTTSSKPVNAARSGLFKITASGPVSSIDWQAFDTEGNVINAKSATVRAR